MQNEQPCNEVIPFLAFPGPLVLLSQFGLNTCYLFLLQNISPASETGQGPQELMRLPSCVQLYYSALG